MRQYLETHFAFAALVYDLLDFEATRGGYGNEYTLHVTLENQATELIGTAQNLDPLDLDPELTRVVIDEADRKIFEGGAALEFLGDRAARAARAHDEGVFLAVELLYAFGVSTHRNSSSANEYEGQNHIDQKHRTRIPRGIEYELDQQEIHDRTQQSGTGNVQ